jgi:hypothetical protein
VNLGYPGVSGVSGIPDILSGEAEIKSHSKLNAPAVMPPLLHLLTHPFALLPERFAISGVSGVSGIPDILSGVSGVAGGAGWASGLEIRCANALVRMKEPIYQLVVVADWIVSGVSGVSGIPDILSGLSGVSGDGNSGAPRTGPDWVAFCALAAPPPKCI